MSAVTAPREAVALLDAYAAARPTRVALTRLDESPSIGPLIALLRERHLPVTFLGTGQRVPEDLHYAKPRKAWLVKTALELMSRQNDINEDFMAEQFAEVSVNACA